MKLLSRIFGLLVMVLVLQEAAARNVDSTGRDIWRNADEATGAKGNYKVSVPYHGVKFVKITPEKK